MEETESNHRFAGQTDAAIHHVRFKCQLRLSAKEFTGIPAGGGTVPLNFTLLHSPNIALPFADWETAGGGTFASLGNATFSSSAPLPQCFYQISVP